ncbi:cysteine protease [uncultured Brevundimonas sp.]|uniref:cysteine protease n=1 Tax=uncultured Brevundimonas sp. TaxID=213418 RepID=UPI002610713E|nr:cysteine protease [uncultured Brevundimonas sp.]
MLMRLLPLIGGLVLSRGTRRIAGRHAGKLALALGAWELWRNYQKSKGPKVNAPAGSPPNGTYGAYPRRRPKKLI